MFTKDLQIHKGNLPIEKIHNSWYEKYKNNINDKMFMIYYDEIPVGTIALYNIDFENNIAEFGRLLIGNTIFRGTNCQAKCNT